MSNSDSIDVATRAAAGTGLVLRESSIDGGKHDDTVVRVYESVGEVFTRWLDNDVDEWEKHPSLPDAAAHYEAMVRDTYPLTDPDTDAPTWTHSDVAGVPTPE